MDHLRILALTASVLIVSAPAAAQWSSFGSIEPSTEYDTAEWMQQSPAAIGEKRVYFNAISGSHYPPASTSGKPYVNPNVALLQTQIDPFGLEYHVAFLGVWTDCNGDGYMGLAEGALREYAADLLLDQSVCPAVTGGTAAWTPGANNYNGWVSEFIPIVRTAGATDLRVYEDADTRVWGDFGRPDERPFYKTCPLFPWSRGTFHNTGGVINYFDCRSDTLSAGILENWNSAMTTIGDPAGLRFADTNDARTGTLGTFDVGGPEDDSHSPATVWDCDAAPAFHSGDAANDTPLGPSVPAAAQNVQVYSVDPQPGNLDRPSATALANHTIEGLQVLQNALGPDANWDCDTSNDFGHDVYSGMGQGVPETDFNGVDPNNKRQANWNLGQVTAARNAGASGGAGIPADAGVGVGGTRYVGDSTQASKPGPRTVRVDLQSGAVGVAPAYYLSFYARVGTNTTSAFAVPAGQGVYGLCGDATSGIVMGWNCDRAAWYQNPDGSYTAGKALSAHPGDAYQLRDVDCYDGRIGDTGVGVQPAFYGTEPCK